MARLGELLVAAGRLTPAQLDEGLRAQVLYGGRLGTNLVELFHLDLDAIALALARQQGVPAALGKHFERCDVTVQARLPRALAERWAVVPIGHLADHRDRIAVAATDALPADARAQVAAALRCPPAGLIVSVAAELRIRYYLERAYGIARGSRFLRVRRSTHLDIPVPPAGDDVASDPALDVDVDLGDDAAAGDDSVDVDLGFGADDDVSGLERDAGELTGDRTIERGAIRPFRRAVTDDEPTHARLEWPAEDTPEPPEIEIDPEVAQVLVNDKRRRFVRTLSDADAEAIAGLDLELGDATGAELPPPPPPPAPAPPAPPPTPVEPEPEPARAAAEAAAPAPPPEGTLARIAIRRVSQPLAARGLATVPDAARAIRRAPSREQVGDLLVRAGLAIAGDAVDAIALFVVREPIAIGWRGEVRGAVPALDAIAVPLDEDGAIARAFQRREPARLDGADAATAIDRRLWKALGGPAPAQVVVAPVLIAQHPVCVLYAHGPRAAAAAADTVIALADAASAAFVRLLRAAQR